MRPLAAFAALAIGTFVAHAIPDLRITVQSTNVILSWPSGAGQTFLVQYRSDLQPGTLWITLTNDLPAESGTNRTAYTHLGGFILPTPCAGGGGGGGQPPLPGGSMLYVPGIEGAVEATTESEAFVERCEPTVALRSDFKKMEIPWPPLPPPLWDTLPPEERARQEAMATDAEAKAAFRDSPQSDDPSCGVNTGFYRVVRTGLNIVNLPAVVSGIVPIQMELGRQPATETVTGAYVTDSQGNAIGGLEIQPVSSGFLQGSWNTAAVGNGSRTLIPGVQLDAYTQFAGTSKTVTVSNAVWFPNYWPLAGEAMRIEVQTLYANGSWIMDIYDDHDTFLASLDGRVSATGYCELDGDPDPTPGFSLSLLDENGAQLPSTFYVVEMGMWAAAVPSGNPQATATQTNFVERSWWQGVATFFNVAYQQIHNPSSQNGTILRMMVGSVVGAAITRYPNFDPNPAVIRGIPDVPFCLLGPAEWATLSTDLTNNCSARNLYYFGHGGPDRIGYADTNQQINLTDLKNILQNAPDPLKGTNAHPYRFVFLDGCKTANGDLSTGFGVPKGNVPITEFTQKRGIRPRAFIGWNKNCTVAWGAFDQQHISFLGSFFDKWANARDPFGDPIGIRAAIQQANPTAWNQKQHLTVHGDEGLWFMDDL